MDQAPLSYDVIVVGGGHAGCEAALAAARMGCATLLVTGNRDTIASMPCNPSIGGPAKGHLVREIDALGGEMGRVIDRTFVQIRMLNTSKGPAVQALRAQADKHRYSREMRRVVESQPGLDLQEAMVSGLERVQGGLRIHLIDGGWYDAPNVVLTTGTFLDGRLVAGDDVRPGGRLGEPPAIGLSASLRGLGLRLGRLKTGTPPRLEAGSIDWSRGIIQPGSSRPLHFSWWWRQEDAIDAGPFPPADRSFPPAPVSDWRPQMACWLVTTTPATHQVIRDNLDRAPMFTGVIEGIGPRYCPSIEDKVVRFAEKTSHGLFLEPEGWDTREVYLQGANTSLPHDVQQSMVHTIPGLERAEIIRHGYAVEYDFVPPDQTRDNLECKTVPGLFLAGQINGTSGYEEAAGQGLLAGINAARRSQRRPPVVLGRHEAYLGVMIDDLVTKELAEPYRLLTSRAEHRLLLRQQNADLRLAPLGYELGLLAKWQHALVAARQEALEATRSRLVRTHVTPDLAAALADHGHPRPAPGANAAAYLGRPDVPAHALSHFGIEAEGSLAEELDVSLKYAGYVARQQTEVARQQAFDDRAIPENYDYDTIGGLRTEGRQKLHRFAPRTVGQARRIQGVTPADISLLLVHLQRGKRVVTV